MIDARSTAISALLSPSRHVRRHAFDRLPADRDGAFAARELLATDEDAGVRARAAAFLAHGPGEVAVPALLDALEDTAPLVRHASVRALGELHASPAADAVRGRAADDPVWWVRRAAVVSAARLAGAGALPALRAALDDPFWRVRAAAARALFALGGVEPELLGRIAEATTERSAGALAYVARRLDAAGTPAAPAPWTPWSEPSRMPGQPDPDPAVAAARIARGEEVSAAFLVECLGDPHEALRVAARKRLARSGDARALELALLWLEEPRIPHAAATVIKLLDGLDRAVLEPVLDAAIARGSVGPSCWAASYIGLTRDAPREGALVTLATSEHATVRATALSALAELRTEVAKAAIVEALADADPLVLRAATQAALALELTSELAAITPPPDAPTRRMLAAAAVGREDRAAIDRAVQDEDVRVRAIAIRALDASSRARFAADPDPWIRAAALDASTALDALARDPHPWVRRAAFRLGRAGHPGRAGELASQSSDPWLLTRACAALDPDAPDHLARLLVLSRHRSPGVRGAAAETLLAFDGLDRAIDALLAAPAWRGDAHAELRIAGHALRARRFDDDDMARLASLREGEPAAVRAWIDDVRGVAPQASREERSLPPARAFAEAGGARLVVSGAGMLPTRAYADAHRAGCGLFFWEPRYRTLGRFLSQEKAAGVIAGTYEASERAITSDVDRSLRRLRRGALDVFLLFWARSPARVDAEAFGILERLKAAGKIRAFGFSTHDRSLACTAVAERAWDVVMIRHSLAHPGAEERLFPLARERGVRVLGFSALSYGRVLGEGVTAAEAYRYTLSQPGVTAVLSAPRTIGELAENLGVLGAPPLSVERQVELRARGATVREESRDFGASIRRHPIGLGEATGGAEVEALTRWLDREDALDPRFG